MLVCFKYYFSDYVRCALSTKKLLYLLKYRFLIIFPLSANSRSPFRHSSSLCSHSHPDTLQSHFYLSCGLQECIPYMPPFFFVCFKSSFPSNSKLVFLPQRWKQVGGVTANITRNLGDICDSPGHSSSEIHPTPVVFRSFTILIRSLSHSVHMTLLFLQDISWNKKGPDWILEETFTSLGQ